ncbi:MAG: hypothetical protein QW831_07510, partial [Candidatus Jordarchaeaceae archaeon]
FYNPYVLPGTSTIQESFFNSTIYKLLYYHAPEPKLPPNQYNNLNYNLYTQMSKNKYPLVIGGNETPQTTYIYLSSWTAGFRTLNHFKPVFISSNGLVKIYEIDYSILDSKLDINDLTVYNDSTGVLNISNTGLTKYNITQILSNGTSCTPVNITLPISLAPGETKEINFNVTQTVSVGDKLIIRIVTSIPDFYVEKIVTVKAKP